MRRYGSSLTSAACLLGIGLLFDFSSPVAAKRRSGLCDPREFYDDIPQNPRNYMQCTPKVKQVGEWEELKCPPAHKFQKILQKCMSKDAMKRQYVSPNCQNPFGNNCPTANLQQPATVCQASNVNPIIGNQCAWVTATLQPDPTSQNYFLQCTPANQGAACGTWQRMACTAGSYYNPQLQVCVTQNLQNNCQPNSQPIVPCGYRNQCPSSCSCFVGTCCQPYVQPTVAPPIPAPPQPFCPNGQPAIATCVGTGPSTCPLNYQCVNGGCCIAPLPTCPNGAPAVGPCLIGGPQQCQAPYVCLNGGCCQQPLPQCPNGVSAIQACIGTGPTSCPAGYVCQNGACCQATCADGSAPNQSCPTGVCPSGFQCQNGVCCRIPLPPCPSGQLAIQTCLGTGQSTCQIGFYCANGGCCPLPQCPNGQPALQVCSPGGICPGGLVCQNNGCCQPPLPNCPNGVVASGLCNGPGTCPANQYCYNQGCCSIPTCPSGQLAVQPCGIQGFQCPSGYRCVNGGCCALPLPTCVSGQQATQSCSGPGSCPNDFYCLVDTGGNQGCCPVPRCADGTPAVAPCFGGAPCPQNYVCQNGGCCQLPTCPNGQPGTQACAGPGTCPSGTTCQNGVCCLIPQCPNGQPSVQICNSLGQCPSGYACQNGGCCSIPTCQNGSPAVQSCVGTGQGSCPIGYQCFNGGCCPIQLVTVPCPYGGTSVQRCGVGQTCPAAYVCYQGECCPPPPLPICPNGQRASQTCVVTGGFGGPSSCPPNYQCYNGGCCPVNTNVYPTCPQVQQPICYCASYNSACPQSTSCYGGTCCAGNQSPLYNTVRPGDRCPDGTVCPGLSQCVSGYCVCGGYSRSNGVTCVAYASHKEKKNMKKIRLFHPTDSCGQFGSECEKLVVEIEKTKSGKIRRKAPTMRDLGIQNNTEPIFWYTFSRPDHFCNTSADCTPDMTCIKRKCLPYLMPGETGCKLNEQCNSTCIGSICVQQEGRNATVCQCEPGRIFYAKKCWRDCPSHTKAHGETCVPVKMEKTGVKSKPVVLFIKLVQLHSSNSKFSRTVRPLVTMD